AAPVVPFHAYVVVLPQGAPSRAEYGRDFNQFTAWFDARITADLARASATLPVDPAQTYVAGFSLGGDLTWALLARHPDTFRGALVLGSRCSATMTAAAAARLRTHGTRVVLGIGYDDDPARVQGLLQAGARLRAARVEATVVRYIAAHEPPR